MTRGSPYQGLSPYLEADADYFFGRDTAIEVIIDNLLAYRLSLLYGPSGVGKSSLLHAGVVHRLRRSALDGSFRSLAPTPVLTLRTWLQEPQAALVRLAREALGPDVAGRTTERDSLVDVLAAWAETAEAPLLLLLDQFEEYFVYHGRPGQIGAFADELADVLSSSGVPVNLLISIREDAVPRLDVFDGVVPGLFDNLIRVEHLDEEAGREAITGPLERWNADRARTEPALRIEPALVDAVLQQVRMGQVRLGRAGRGAVHGEPDGDRPSLIEAPYLQLVMTRIFEEERRDDSAILRAATLNELGGAERIVQTHLDETMSSLAPSARRTAERMFEYLVTPSGTKIALPASALAKWSERDDKEVAAVLHQLAAGDRRILRTVPTSGEEDGGTSYEIFHDRLAPAILEYGARRQHARRRRRLRLLGGVTFGLLAVLAVVFFGFVGARSELAAVERIEAQIEQVELRDRRYPLSDYLLETGQPTTGLTAAERREPGLLFAVRVRLVGYQGQRVSLSFTVLDARTDRPLLPASVYSQTSTTLVAESSDQSRAWPVWTPSPARRQRVYVRFVLRADDYAVLAQADSRRFLAGSTAARG